MTKLKKLCEIEGFEDEQALFEAFIMDSVCPAICINPDCDYSEHMEPDQDRGWCPECKTNTLKSAMILGGII
jgi:hypothetical protein